MLAKRVSGLPVASKGALVGIVTEGDFLRRAETGPERQRPRWLEFLLGPGRLSDEYAAQPRPQGAGGDDDRRYIRSPKIPRSGGDQDDGEVSPPSVCPCCGETNLLHATAARIRLARLLGREQPPAFLHHPSTSARPTARSCRRLTATLPSARCSMRVARRGSCSARWLPPCWLTARPWMNRPTCSPSLRSRPRHPECGCGRGACQAIRCAA